MIRFKNRKYYPKLLLFSLNNILSIILVFFSINIVISEENCTDTEPYKNLNACVSSCSEDDIFKYKTCIPISSNEEDILKMVDIIKNYIKKNDIKNEIIIEGEGINYQITTNYLINNENNSNNSINLTLGEECSTKIKETLNNDFYIILINIINSNYTTSLEGFKVIAIDTELSINLLCGGYTISFDIPISIQNETLAVYKQLNEEYNYDILNLNSSFFTDICELYTTEDNTDMSLSKRIEIFGSHGINPCAENCEYKKFDNNSNKVNCECYIKSGVEDDEEQRNLGQQIYDKLAEFLDLINFDVMFCFKLVYSVGFKNLIKNYGFMILTTVGIAFIIIMIICFFIIRQRVVKIVSGFDNLRDKLKNMLEEMNKKENNIGNINNENKVENNNNIENDLNLNNNNNINKLTKKREKKNKISKKEKVNPKKEKEDQQKDEESIKKKDENMQKEEENKPKEEENIPKKEENIQKVSENLQKEEEYQKKEQENLQKEEEKKEENIEEEKKDYEEGEEEEDDEEEEEEDDDEEGEEEEEKQNKEEVKEKEKEKEEPKIINDSNIENEILKEETKRKENEKDKESIKEEKENEKEKINYIEEPKPINISNHNKNTNSKNDNNNNNNNNNINIPPFYYDYNKYYNDYYNYMQYYNNIYNLNIFSINNNNYNLDQEKQNNPNQSDTDKDKFIKLIIPYQKIKEKIKEKVKNKLSKSKKKLKDKEGKKVKKRNDLISEDEDKRAKIKKRTKKLKTKKMKDNNELKENNSVEKKIKKIKKTKKSPNKKKESKPMEFQINVEDIFKQNPPKKKKNANLSKEKLVSSGKEVLNLNNIDDSRKEDNSIYNINKTRRHNKKQKSTKSNNGIILYNKKNKEKNLINEMDNTKIQENEDQINQLNNQEIDIKFGVDEFYQKVMKLPEDKRCEFFIDEELNSLDYQYAIEIDKRSFFNIYLSLLKRQNILIFCLSYCSNDYNLSILKFSLLIFQFILFITVSAFFFTDNTLNNIYERKNKFDVPFMIRQLGLTFIICYGVNLLFKILIKTDNRIIDIKEENENIDDGISSIRCKIIFYFTFTMMIIIFGWFYISCFCAVYSHTQIILLKCGLYSLAVTFVYPFIFCLISPLIRISALSDEKRDKKCLYEFSKVISYI